MTDKFDDGRLIELVREFSHLYDKRNISFKNKLAVQNAWQTISEMFNVSVEECEPRWNTIRHQFAKERSSIKHPPSGSATLTTWPYYEICNSFLDKVVLQRKTTSNMAVKAEVAPKLNLEITNGSGSTAGISGDFANETEDVVMNELVATNSSIKTSSGAANPYILQPTGSVGHTMPLSSRKAKRAKLDPTQELAVSIQTAFEKLAKCMDTNTKEEDDADYVFGKMVAKELQKIKDNKKKIVLKSKIIHLIAEDCE